MAARGTNGRKSAGPRRRARAPADPVERAEFHLLEGRTPLEVERALCNEFQITDRHARRHIDAARKRWADSNITEAQARKAHVYRRSLKEGKPGTALAALKEMGSEPREGKDPVGAPPTGGVKDTNDRNAWGHKLCAQLAHEARNDTRLSPAQQRAETNRHLRTMAALTPLSEQADTKRAIRKSADDLEEDDRDQELDDVPDGASGSLRSDT